jgi:hypothetical protein
MQQRPALALDFRRGSIHVSFHSEPLTRGPAPSRLYDAPSSAPCRVFLSVAGLCIVLPVRGLSDYQQHFAQFF